MPLSFRIALILVPYAMYAQGAATDYQRAAALREKFQNLTVDLAGPATWIDGAHFWYRKSVKGGNQFVLVDAEAQTGKPAFDHQKLAEALSSASGSSFGALALPFQEITFTDNRRVIGFNAAGSQWQCALADYSCRKTGSAPQATGGRGGRGGAPPQDDDDFESPSEPDFPVADGMSYESPQQGQGGG